MSAQCFQPRPEVEPSSAERRSKSSQERYEQAFRSITYVGLPVAINGLSGTESWKTEVHMSYLILFILCSMSLALGIAFGWHSRRRRDVSFMGYEESEIVRDSPGAVHHRTQGKRRKQGDIDPLFRGRVLHEVIGPCI